MKTSGLWSIAAMALLAGVAAAQKPAQNGAAPPAANGQPPTVIQPGPSQGMPKSVCAASDASREWECPTCGHHGVCVTCESKDRPCLKKLYRWMFYHPSEPACRDCGKCANPCHPPLYSWFPCNGCCSSCPADKCSSGVCRPDRMGRLAGGHQRCPKGQVGSFRFIGICKPKMPCMNGQCGTDAVMDGPMLAPGVPAAPAVPAQPQAEAPVQQTVSYKKDVDSAITSAVQKPAPTKRITTYRPDGIATTMPVLSPDQFRRSQR